MQGIFSLLVLLAVGVLPAIAQEERAIDNFAGVGVRAMGMGGAFVGVADDFTALYWNPAGLAQIRHREVHVAFLRHQRTSDAVLAGTQATSKLGNTHFGSLGLVFPYPVYQGSLVFAGGFNQIKNFDWSLRQRGFDGGLETDHTFRHEGGLTLAALAGGIDVSPSISLGLALGLVSGEDEAINEFNWIDTQDRFLEKRFLARDTFDDQYQSAFYTCLGAMIRTPREKPRFRLGATVAMNSAQRISYTFRGSLSEQGYDRVEYDDGTLQENPPQEVRDSYKLSLPLEFGLGASWAPVKGVLLAGSLYFAEWKQSQYEGEDEGGLRTSTSFERQYRNAMRYHLGVEWQVPVIALDLRAGFYADPLPFVGPRDPERLPDPETNPEIEIERDRHFFTLGAGLLLDEVVQVDLAWVRGSFEQQEGELKEKDAISRLFAAVAYRF